MKESLVASNSKMLELLQEYLQQGKQVRLKIRGSSMAPLLRNDLDQVELTSPADRELVPGAVVLFKFREAFVLHRIVGRDEKILTLRGDNICQSKEVASVDQVLGIVRKIIYPDGRILFANSLYWKIKFRGWLLVKPVFLIFHKIKVPFARIYRRMKK